jgi:hypothetical protein
VTEAAKRDDERDRVWAASPEGRAYMGYRDRLITEGPPGPVRVLCAKAGHLIAVVDLVLIGTAGPMLAHPRYKRVGGRIVNKNGWFAAVAHDTQAFLGHTTLVCPHSRCGYKGSFLQRRLITWIAEAAFAGHQELRLQA